MAEETKPEKGRIGIAKKIKDAPFKVKLGIVITTAIVLLLLGNTVFAKTFYGNILNVLAFLAILIPSLYIGYRHYMIIRVIEDMFPLYLRNVAEIKGAGMPLPQAMLNASKEDYGALTPYVKKLAAQVSWGMPVTEALKRMERQIKSPVVSKAIRTAIEVNKYGGDLSLALNSVADSISQIKEIQKKRIAAIYGNITEGYLMFMVFLATSVLLINFLIPTLGTMGGGAEAAKQCDLKVTYAYFIVVQSVFGGMALGKLSEGRVVAGAKHIGIKLTLGVIIMQFFIGISVFLLFGSLLCGITGLCSISKISICMA